jgi:hypothetical protein
MPLHLPRGREGEVKKGLPESTHMVYPEAETGKSGHSLDTLGIDRHKSIRISGHSFKLQQQRNKGLPEFTESTHLVYPEAETSKLEKPGHSLDTLAYA